MKFDMCGAASVFGTMRAIARAQGARSTSSASSPPARTCRPGRATKPGDIVKSMSGQTIEILNTDAEGRLILADALTYAERYEPEAVVDIATLTGAMVIALGHVAAGVFSNNDALARALCAAGDDAYDRAWPLPLWDDYHDGLAQQLRGFRKRRRARRRQHHRGVLPVASSRRSTTGRTSTSRASSHKEGKEKGATGRPVPLLDHWLLAAARASPPDRGRFPARPPDDTIDFYTHCRRPPRGRGPARRQGVGAARPRSRAHPGRSGHGALDRLLWAQPATGFLPHCRLGSPLAAETPVIVDHALEHDGPADGADQPSRVPRRRSSPASSGWPRSSSRRRRPTRPRTRALEVLPRPRLRAALARPVGTALTPCPPRANCWSRPTR